LGTRAGPTIKRKKKMENRNGRKENLQQHPSIGRWLWRSSPEKQKAPLRFGEANMPEEDHQMVSVEFERRLKRVPQEEKKEREEKETKHEKKRSAEKQKHLRSEKGVTERGEEP